MIHPLACVHPNAKIAENVTIGPFTFVSDNVEIGEGTVIASNVSILEGARIGKNCEIFPGAVISAIPQDLKYRGEDTLTIIGDHTNIRECVTVNKGTVDRMQTVVGHHCHIMAYTHIAHDCIVGNHCILSNYTGLAGHVLVEDHVVLGGFTGVVQFTRIGKHSFAIGSVRKDIPPYSRVAREPTVYVGVNTVGLRRRGFSNDQIREIQEIYKIMYYSDRNISQACTFIEQEMPSTPIREDILGFIKGSIKGIISKDKEEDV